MSSLFGFNAQPAWNTTMRIADCHWIVENQQYAFEVTSLSIEAAQNTLDVSSFGDPFPRLLAGPIVTALSFECVLTGNNKDEATEDFFQYAEHYVRRSGGGSATAIFNQPGSDEHYVCKDVGIAECKTMRSTDNFYTVVQMECRVDRVIVINTKPYTPSATLTLQAIREVAETIKRGTGHQLNQTLVSADAYRRLLQEEARRQEEAKRNKHTSGRCGRCSAYIHGNQPHTCEA